MNNQSQPQRAFLVFSGSNPRAVMTFLRVLKKLEQRIVIIARSTEDLIFLSSFQNAVFAVRESDHLDWVDVKNCIGKVRSKTGLNEFVICPSSEFLNQFLLKYRDSLESINCFLPLVDESTYKKVSDKSTSVKMVKDHGLDTPREIDLPDQFTGPIVAKPKANIDENWCSRYPIHILNSECFKSFKNKPDLGAYFFQEYVSGDSFYLLAYISLTGDVCFASQKNLAQQADGKSIVLAESTDFHLSETAHKSIEMLKAEHFFGLVMIEFIESNGKYYFIEINPRLWGPMELLTLSNSQLIIKFICDSLGLSFNKEKPQLSDKNSKARYLWLGGFLTNRRAGKVAQWRGVSGFKRFTLIMGSLFSDVYLRMDSWRVFLFELTGLRLTNPR